VFPSSFGPRNHSQQPIISLPTIYISSPLCYLPLLETDITLSTLLSVSPQYTILHPYVTFHFWPQISLSAPYYQSPHNIQCFTLCYFYIWPLISHSAPYYESPHNIQFFTPVLPYAFIPRYHSQHPIMSLPKIYSSSPLCYFPIWPQISLSAPYH